MDSQRSVPIHERFFSTSPWFQALLILGVSLLALLPAWINYDIISRDGAFQYIPMASLFFEGRVADAFARPQLPLFPILISSLSWLTGLDFEMSGRLISVVAFLLSGLCIFKLTCLVFEERSSALLAVLFFVTNRELVERSVDCLKESLLVALVLWGNYLIISAIIRGGERRSKVAAGTVLLALGGMVRATSWFFIASWLILWVFADRKTVLRRLTVVVLPVIILLALAFINIDNPFFARKGVAFVQILDALRMLEFRPGTMLSILVSLFATGNELVMVFALAGLWFLRSENYTKHCILILLFFFVVLNIMGWTSDRYLIAPAVWLYPLAAEMTSRTLGDSRKILRVLAMIVIVTCPLFWADKAFTPPDEDKLARKAAGEWILSQTGPDMDILTNRDRLAFYAKARPEVLDAGGDPGDNMVIAVDVLLPDGVVVKETLDSKGVAPDRSFGTIYVYLPKA